jgi:hypothetical protein
MASINILKLTQAEIDSTIYALGLIIYNTDTRAITYDGPDGYRMITTDIISLETELVKEQYPEPDINKLYLVRSSSKLYRYAGEWVTVTDVATVNEIIYDCAILTPIIMNDNGVNVAPATIASNVYMQNGSSVEAMLSTIYKTNFEINRLKCHSYTVEAGINQREFALDYPVENYFENDNTLMVFISNTLLPNKYYTISGNTLIINEGYYIQDNMSITFFFLYNTLNLIDSGNLYTNGTFITPYSIPVNRLQSITDKIDIDNSYTIPTSKALYTLQQIVSSLVASGQPVVSTKTVVTTSYVTATMNRQTTFKIPFPFDNYLKYGNSMLIYNGQLFIDDRRYTISNDNLILTDDDLSKDQQLTFMFIYNTASGNDALNPSAIPKEYASICRFRDININNSKRWVDICYGKGLYVAISDTVGSSMIMTSKDGENWTERPMNIQNIWTSICFGNGTFVAVGHNNDNINCVITSTDGINWSSVTATNNSTVWEDVDYGNGSFIAVASQSSKEYQKIMVSVNDGLSWTALTSPVKASLRKVFYGNGQYVIIGTDIILVSSNYVNWKVINKPGVIDGIYHQGGFYFIDDYNNIKTLSYTKDFINFTPSTLANDYYPRQIISANDKLIIICDNVSSSVKLIISDGFNQSYNYILTTDYEYNKFRFTYGNGLIIGVKPEENVVLVSGTQILPELGDIYYGIF